MESQILRWLLNPGFNSSPFKESRFFQWFSRLRDRILFRSPISTNKILTTASFLLSALIFACIFIPRVPVDSIIPFYWVDFRTEDFLLLIVAVFTFALIPAKIALPEIPRVEKAFLWFLLAAQSSILSGLLYRTSDKPFLSLLYLLKWTEYFLVFVLTCRLTAHKKAARFFLRSFFLLGLAVAAFGYWEHCFPAAKAIYPNYYRLFERPPFHGDANHIGGLLVLWLGFSIGLFLKAKDHRAESLLLTCILFVFFPLIWTYSRKSYFALAGAVTFSFLFRGNRKKLLFLGSLFVILSLLLPTRLSERLTDLGEAFSSADPFHSSWAGNWVMWKEAFWNFEKFLLFGSGLGSRHRLYYESQYVLVLAETGFVGFTAFIFLIVSLMREVASAVHRNLTALDSGVVLGWVIGFIGLLIHNGSCVSWTVSKIAIPFWFLTAAALTYLRQILTSQQKMPRASPGYLEQYLPVVAGHGQVAERSEVP